MSRIADRLRGIVGAGRIPGEAGSSAFAEAPADRDDAIAEILGGEWRDAGGGRFLVIDRTYRPGHRHGRLTLLDHLLPEDDGWARVLLAADRFPAGADAGERALFIDLETTGIAGGAGTYAFLVGCGWFEGATFRVRQFFMSTCSAERALLDALAEIAASVRLVVSYNGKTFDLPLIETRYLFNRMETPFAPLPHLDMLHPARRLWRTDGDNELSTRAGCRLTTLEQTVCGHSREGDVPGFEIPSRYFHYLRTGDPRPLEAVFEHNRLDLLSLAFLTARAAQLVGDGPPSLKTAREAVGLGHLYERAGLLARARACFACGCGMDGAVPLPGDEPAFADALRAYALLCRRQRQFADAAVAWRLLVDLRRCPPHVIREATEALAVHHEHRERDLRAARAFAMRSLPLHDSAPRRQALQHRLARLDRKLAWAQAAPALF
jgi:uncharacterized protein YprB with RNaseH-like and TPR domain